MDRKLYLELLYAYREIADDLGISQETKAYIENVIKEAEKVSCTKNKKTYGDEESTQKSD